MSSSFLCIFCQRYLLDSPRQAPCGDRLCGSCYNSLRQREKEKVTCPVCEQEIQLSKCFKDKAVELELANVTVKCSNPDCPWEGQCTHFHEHTKQCRYALISCSNEGCTQRVRRRSIDRHLLECPLAPVPCEWCRTNIPPNSMGIHLAECGDVLVACKNNCGEKCARRDLAQHLETACQLQERPCIYRNDGCQFLGNFQELRQHELDSVSQHLHYLRETLRLALGEYEATNRELTQSIKDTERKLAAMKSQIAQIQAELSLKVQPMVDALVKVESAIQQLQEGFAEVALMVQTLQATSYNGTLVWKIPEVQRRRQEAKIGKTISLYSAPFYTGRHGYKVCLRLYMDGDGSGKGSHLSFFLTIMRGEFDALLPWPFKQTVTLMLLDQDRQRDIVQSFRPEPTSSSFQRPQNEMNVASGCPLFAPLSILNNPSYVKDDTMFLKCVIDTNGLDHT